MQNLNNYRELIDYIQSLEKFLSQKSSVFNTLEMASYVFLTRFERVKLSIKILLSIFK